MWYIYIILAVVALAVCITLVVLKVNQSSSIFAMVGLALVGLARRERLKGH